MEGMNMADEYDLYGRRKHQGVTGTSGPDYLDQFNNVQNDFALLHFPGNGNLNGSGTRQTNRSHTFSNRFETGMKAVADTNDAQSDPDRAASALLMKAMKHGAVSSSIQEEHDFANAPFTRAMQGMNHEAAPETIENVTDLEKQPTSLFSGRYAVTVRQFPG